MALDQYNIELKTDYVQNALISTEGPIIGGIKVNRLMNMYQETFNLLMDSNGEIVTDNNLIPVLDGPIGYVAGRIYIFCSWIQILEQIKYALYTQTDLQTAMGFTLDRWGTLLATLRGGQGDAAYKMSLFLSIIEYTSKGQAEVLIQIFLAITGAVSVSLLEFFPAKFQLTAIGGQPTYPIANIQAIIQATKAGGVGFQLVIASLKPFGFLGNPGAGSLSAYNSSNQNLNQGGQFAGAIF